MSEGNDARERERFWRALETQTERIHAIETSVEQRAVVMKDVINTAVKDAMPKALLTDEEHRWVRLAIEREAQSIAFRKAVIDKTLLGLIWGVVSVMGTFLYAGLKEWAKATLK